MAGNGEDIELALEHGFGKAHAHFPDCGQGHPPANTDPQTLGFVLFPPPLLYELKFGEMDPQEMS